MTFRTRVAAAKVREALDIREKVSKLRGIYRGERCYLVAGGPSTGHVSKETLQLMRKHPTIAVKHALSVVPFADIHILNQYKYVPYAYADEKPIVIATTQRHRPMPPKNCDIIVPLQSSNSHSDTISGRRDFDEYTFDHRLMRGWGPSIFFELGVYLAVHCGASELVTLGIDFVDAPHFWAGKFPRTAGSKREAILSEYAAIKAALPAWYSWLKSQGVLWKFIETPVPSALTGIVPSITL
jgi:hypothetical protein